MHGRERRMELWRITKRGDGMTRFMLGCVLAVVVVAVAVTVAPVFQYAITGVVVLCRTLGGIR